MIENGGTSYEEESDEKGEEPKMSPSQKYNNEMAMSMYAAGRVRKLAYPGYAKIFIKMRF